MSGLRTALTYAGGVRIRQGHEVIEARTDESGNGLSGIAELTNDRREEVLAAFDHPLSPVPKCPLSDLPEGEIASTEPRKGPVQEGDLVWADEDLTRLPDGHVLTPVRGLKARRKLLVQAVVLGHSFLEPTLDRCIHGLPLVREPYQLHQATVKWQLGASRHERTRLSVGGTTSSPSVHPRP